MYAERESGSQGFGGIPSFIGQTEENKGVAGRVPGKCFVTEA